MTALVLMYLRREFHDEKDTWDLVAKKSLAWLCTQELQWKNERIGDVEDLLSAASTWLPSDAGGAQGE